MITFLNHVLLTFLIFLWILTHPFEFRCAFLFVICTNVVNTLLVKAKIRAIRRHLPGFHVMQTSNILTVKLCLKYHNFSFHLYNTFTHQHTHRGLRSQPCRGYSACTLGGHHASRTPCSGQHWLRARSLEESDRQFVMSNLKKNTI